MKEFFDSSKLMNRFFKKVDNAYWDIMTGRIGVKTNEGISTIEGTGDDAQVVINIMDQFAMPVPAFAQNTPVSAVAEGDLIFSNAGNVLGWVTKKNDKSFTIMKPSGQSTSWTPPKVQMFGLDGGGVMVLRSLVNMLPGGTSGLGAMQNMIMPMMLMGGNNIDLESMLPIMLMSQMGIPNADGTSTPATGLNMNNMLMPMMMMQMMKGNNTKFSGSDRFTR